VIGSASRRADSRWTPNFASFATLALEQNSLYPLRQSIGRPYRAINDLHLTQCPAGKGVTSKPSTFLVTFAGVNLLPNLPWLDP
jgi:hypothetical protein